MSDILINEVMNPDDRKACFSIRVEVFCVEQRVNRAIEFDGMDDQCRHYIATYKGNCVGTARTRQLSDTEVKFERVAVLREHRKNGIGRLLMARGMSDAAHAGYRRAVLNSQVHAGPFYEKLGFRSEGDVFLEAGIPHRSMSKEL
ncbi:MAG: GNAT family N-acetyltransferase [Pseudomonadota bacterium]|nr:GNAT family N-acetyltransferase [Pseudomonadota bacterium]